MKKLLKLSLQIELLKSRRSAIIVLIVIAIQQSFGLSLGIDFKNIPEKLLNSFIYKSFIVGEIFSYVLIAVMIIVAYTVAQEYKEKSLHYQLINGLSRKLYVFGKLLISLLFGVFLLLVICGITLSFLHFNDNNSFSFSFSFIKEVEIMDILFFACTLPIFTLLGIFIGRILSNSVVAIGLIIIYIIIEKALLFFDEFFWNINLKYWLPLELFGSPEATLQLILIKLLYVGVISCGVIWVFMKKDFK